MLTPSCPGGSLPHLDHHGYQEKSREKTTYYRVSERKYSDGWVSLTTNLGSGLGISNKLFICVPPSTVLAELEVETGYKGAKYPSTLG